MLGQNAALLFWSYNLAAHHAEEHPSHPLPDVANVSALWSGSLSRWWASRRGSSGTLGAQAAQ